MTKDVPFAEEDPRVREQSEAAFAKNGLKSLMPEEIYTDPNFEWDEGPE